MSDDNSHLFEAPSPMARHLGIEMTGWGDGWARIEAPNAPYIRNRQGLPHGGLHATLLDTVMGFAGCFTGWGDGWARIEAPNAPYIRNRQGLPHGGLHATLLDTVMGFAGCFTGDANRHQMALTLSMTVNYLGQAQGARLIAEGRITGGGRKTYFAESDVRDDTGALIAKASGVFRYRGTPEG